MAFSMDELEEAGFAQETWPDELPEPGPSNLEQEDLEGTDERYRYQIEVDGQAYGMEVDLDTSTVPDPEEGVVFMLNQFAFLWRTNQEEIEVNPDGSLRRIDF